MGANGGQDPGPSDCAGSWGRTKVCKKVSVTKIHVALRVNRQGETFSCVQRRGCVVCVGVGAARALCNSVAGSLGAYWAASRLASATTCTLPWLGGVAE